MNVPRLAKWLSRLPRAQIEKLSLIYLSVQGEEPVRHWRLADLPPEIATSEKDLAIDIIEAAQEDCNGREYQSRYSLRAYTEANEQYSAMVIKSRPEGSTDPEGVGDPSLAGITAQTLRHNEALMRMVVGSMSTIMGAQQQIIEMQARQITNLHQKDQAREESAADDPDSIAKAESMIKLTDAVVEHVIPRVAQYLDMIPMPNGNAPQ